LSGGFIVYTPVSNFVGNDQFTYTLTDSGGAQAQGTVSVNVLALSVPPSNHMTITLVSSGRFILYAGAVSQGYVVQYANVLPGPWLDLSADLTAGTPGTIEYNDLTAPLPATRFYRVRTGP
jgi:hypothetical protein